MVYLLTTEGSAGLKDDTKGVPSALADICSLKGFVKGFRGVELRERDSASLCSQVWL